MIQDLHMEKRELIDSGSIEEEGKASLRGNPTGTLIQLAKPMLGCVVVVGDCGRCR